MRSKTKQRCFLLGCGCACGLFLLVSSYWIYCEYFCEKQVVAPKSSIVKDTIPGQKESITSKLIENVIEQDKDSQPEYMLSQRVDTPEYVSRYGRVFFDTPKDMSGYWALLRAVCADKDNLMHRQIYTLKKLAAVTAFNEDNRPPDAEIKHMLSSGYDLDTSHMVYLSKGLKRDIIVSNDMDLGFDLFTEIGETYHYDSIDELEGEANTPETIWLHVQKQDDGTYHWFPAIPDEHDLIDAEEISIDEISSVQSDDTSDDLLDEETAYVDTYDENDEKNKKDKKKYALGNVIYWLKK